MKAIFKNNTELRIIAPIVVILLGVLISYIFFKDQAYNQKLSSQL